MKLMDLDDDILTEILLRILPSSLSSVLLVNRRLHKLLQIREIFWTHCLSTSLNYPYIKALPPSTPPKDHFRNLNILSKGAKNGIRWRFQGYVRESEDLNDFTKPSSEFKWRIELDNPAGNEEGVTATIFWYCVKSQWGPGPGLGNWEVEKVRGVFHKPSGTYNCMGYECGAGLQTRNYVFRLEEDGLKLTGKAIPRDKEESFECYMIGLAEAPECVNDPASFIRCHYFPETTPGFSLENGWEDYNA